MKGSAIEFPALNPREVMQGLVKLQGVELIDLLNKINGTERNFIAPYRYDHRDALRIDRHSTFLSSMPFAGAQYLYIEGGAVVITTAFDDAHKKKVIPVTTRKSFFVGLSRLNLAGLDDAVLKAFPERQTYSSCYDNDDYDNDDGGYRDHNELAWNSDLGTFTMGGL